MDEYHQYLARYVYVPLAAVAGAITALASSRTQKTTGGEMLLTFIVGFSFAIFVTPWIAINWFSIPETDNRAIAGLTYVFGAGSNILLPVLINRFRRAIDDRKDGD